MKRRDFLAASTVVGLTPWAWTGAAEQAGSQRAVLELRKYDFSTPEQRVGFEKFAAQAAVPALNRAGIRPVGIFSRDGFGPEELKADKRLAAGELSPVYVLLPHASLESVTTLLERLGTDAEFLEAGADFLQAPASQPAYKRVESWLMTAFTGMPQVEVPVTSPGRIFELRIYESPSEITGQKKIEMFNDAGELAIFRRVGLHPVFFGETVIGSGMPNLTYMLSFESMEQRQANWGKFGQDPDWRRLRGMDEYADKNILSGITQVFLKPLACSQI
jgi:hypothetical protein